jgi:hypothetical protein
MKDKTVRLSLTLKEAAALWAAAVAGEHEAAAINECTIGWTTSVEEWCDLANSGIHKLGNALNKGDPDWLNKMHEKWQKGKKED